jgi:hypothetical protein
MHRQGQGNQASKTLFLMKSPQRSLRAFYLFFAAASLAASLLGWQVAASPPAEANSIASASPLPASPSPKPTPSPKATPAPAVQNPIDLLQQQINALKAQNAQLQASISGLQAQITVLQSQTTAIAKSLQPTPRPPGTLNGPGIMTWSDLRQNLLKPIYDDLLIPFYTNPGQTPGPSLPLEHRLANPTPSPRGSQRP